ncbi:MAG TPA: HK97 gp10 family phage protein [Methylocystis sp.]
MTEKTFSAAVDEWVRATKARTEATFKRAAEMVAEEILERTPIDTGFLRHSFQASGTQVPVIRAEAVPSDAARKKARDEKLASYGYEAGPINLIILNIPAGKPIYFGFVARYAAAVEFGSEGRPAKGMVRLAAQNWQHIVNAAAAEVKAAVNSRSSP